MNIVPPSGPRNAAFAIVGEAPASEEVRQGRGFVGPSGRMIWPVLRRLASLEREECWVSNLCKHPLDNSESGDAKLSEKEFEQCKVELFGELLDLSPIRVLAVGALAARALLELAGRKYHRMEVHNGMTYQSAELPWSVTPCWHPAAALHGDGGKDPLAWMADAMAHLRTPRFEQRITVPPWRELSDVQEGSDKIIAIDTEGTPDDPICLTWATLNNRYYVEPEDVKWFWSLVVESSTKVIYHNAPWDWAVIEAMGVKDPWRVPFADTMELAYLKQTEPQGLKDLARRYFGFDMKSWEDVVMPHYNELVLAVGAGKLEAGTTTITHTKTGKLRKKPIVKYTDEVKPLKRALENPKLMAGRIGEFPAPSLRMVPDEETAEYATLDPFVTRHLWEVLK